MTRHIIDRNRGDAADRLRRYLALERQMTPHPVTRGLRLRPAIPDTGRRLREFLRIERGSRV